jgi:hypothetical protein
VKIRKVEANNRKSEFRVVTYAGVSYVFPYVRAESKPESTNSVEEVAVDRELASEAFTHVLESGDEGSVHLDQVLDCSIDLVVTDKEAVT